MVTGVAGSILGFVRVSGISDTAASLCSNSDKVLMSVTVRPQVYQVLVDGYSDLHGATSENGTT